MDYRKTTSHFNNKSGVNDLKLRKYSRKVADSRSNKPNSEMKNMMKQRHDAVYHKSAFSLSVNMENNTKVEEEPVKESKTMCRICQSLDDSLENQQVTPCACSGSLQFVHLNCLRQWRLTKKAKGADISCCELCKQPYNVELLGTTDVQTDNLLKMQEDLRQLVKSGIYLMLLVKSWKQDVLRLNRLQTNTVDGFDEEEEIDPATVSARLTDQLQQMENSSNEILFRNNCLPSHQLAQSSQSRERHVEVLPPSVSSNQHSGSCSSSDDDDEYISREELKRGSEVARIDK